MVSIRRVRSSSPKIPAALRRKNGVSTTVSGIANTILSIRYTRMVTSSWPAEVAGPAADFGIAGEFGRFCRSVAGLPAWMRESVDGEDVQVH